MHLEKLQNSISSQSVQILNPSNRNHYDWKIEIKDLKNADTTGYIVVTSIIMGIVKLKSNSKKYRRTAAWIVGEHSS